MFSRIAIMVLRVCALAAIVLGVLFWTGHALALRQVHMTLGTLVVLALWALAVALLFARGVTVPVRAGLAAGAVVVGALLAVVGMTQERLMPGAQHWVIQVGHLGLALAAIALGEMIAARALRSAKLAKVAAR
ncbi:MAG TPA: hypothetical protein VF116_17850 [Ktedonobacterales bacterium]